LNVFTVLSLLVRNITIKASWRWN